MSEITELAEKLKAEGDKIVAIFSRLTEEQWNCEVYTEGTKWTIRNVLSHFVTSERGLLKLFERIRQGGEGSPDDFSIDRYNAAMQERMKNAPPQELIEQYKEVRASAIQCRSGLTPSELDLTGRHPFLGYTAVRDMIKMLYIHNLDHYRDMKKALKD